MPTILIADDNLDFRDVLGDLFRAHGFDVLLADDGQHAWELLQVSIPDIVLSDIHMPRLDGISLCERIRNAPDISNIPVVLLSGNPPKTRPTSVSDVICKPVQLEELMATLNLALQKANGKI
ncbi:MAG: response regulator [Herminiimonas sp.]|uniref:response regulator n=1 Tax=Herminiimonas sp. TaxID=1926289 RepID=UPI002724A8E0|nr:response regulator [Herminiimonas sp.]MDO9420313.1 response regulator [Herminiimonas sp.]